MIKLIPVFSSIFLFGFGGVFFTPKTFTGYFDTNATTNIQNGTGNWDFSTSNFSYNTTNYTQTKFVSGSNAVFGRAGSSGGAGTVTVSGTQNIASLLFDTVPSGNYTITGGNLTCPYPSCTITNNEDSTIASTIIGNAGWIKDGTSILTLTGTNTYSGVTTVGVGALSLGNGTASGNIIPATNLITNNATLNYNTPSNITHSGVISGTGTFTKQGTGTLILNGSNSYTGNTTVSAGVLQLGDGIVTGNIIPEANLITDNATLNYNTPSDITHSGVISGTGSFTKQGTGTLTFSSVNTNAGPTNISAGTLVLQGSYASTSTVISSGAILELNVSSGMIDFATGTISGTGRLNKTGAGMARWGFRALTMALDAGALIDIQAGNLDAGSGADDNWIGNNSSLNVEAGAILAEITYSTATFDAVTGGGAIRMDGSRSFILGNNNHALGVYNPAGSATFTGVFSQTGNLVKAGSGTQILTGINTYSGTTTISDGILQIDGAGSLGSGSYAGAISIASGATLTYSSSANQTFSGGLGGAGALTKDTSDISALTISGAATYTGFTTINNGRLIISSNTSNNSPNYSIASGATLEYAIATGGDHCDGTSTTYSGAGKLVKSGPGQIRFCGSSTFNFSAGSLIDIQGGTFDAGSGANDTWENNFSSLNIAAGATVAEMAYRPAKFDALTGAGTFSMDSVAGPGPHTVTIGANDHAAGDYNTAGTANFSGIISGGGELIKTGTGTQILSNKNTYSGGTTVNGGTLSLAGGGGINTSTIKGDLIINSGGTVTAPTGWTFGYSESATEAVKSITINGGTLNFTGADSGGGTNSTITMTNGSITGSLFDYYHPSGARTITINPGTSTISSGMDHRIPGGLTFDVAAGGTLNFSGRLRQEATPGDVIKAGPGLMNMTGVNTYTVDTTISGGTFQIGEAGSLGSGSYAGAISIASGATFRYSSSADQALPGAMTGAGGLTKDTSSTSTLTLSGITSYTGATTISDGTLTLVDTTAFNSAITNNATLNLNRSAGFTSRDNIAGNAVSGTGTMNINSAANTPGTSDGGWVIFGTGAYFTGTGPVNVNSGVLSRDNTNPNNLNSSADYTVEANAVFAAGRGGNSNIGGLNGDGTVCACWRDLTNNGYITFGTGDKSGTFSGTIRGNGNAVDGSLDGGIMNVIKTGSGTQTLSGANTYTGSTTVNDGTLKLQNTAGYKTTNLIVNTGGTLQIDFVTGGGASNTPTQAFNSVMAAVTGAGAVSYSCPAGTFCALGHGGGAFTNNLSANGQINILSGSVQWGWNRGSHTSNLGSLNVAAGAEYRNSDVTFQFDKITGSGVIANAYNGAVTLTIGVNGGTSMFSGSIRSGDSYNTVTTGALTLVKEGGGTITLNGASTYTGGTTINAGRIVCGVAGALGTGAVVVNAGAIFTKGPCTNGTSGGGTVN